MIFSKQLKTTERVVTENAPTILTVLGVAGTVATAVLTARAAWKAGIKIEDHESARRIKSEEPMTKVEKTKACWQLFVVPAVVGVGTCGAIIMAQRINAKRAAALMAGYAVLESRYSEYTDKAKEALGVNKEKKIRDEMAQDRVNESGHKADRIVIIEGNEVLCHEAWTDRYFKCNMEKIRRAEADVNAALRNNMGGIGLSEVYDMLDIPHTSESDNFGWKQGQKVEFLITTTTTPDDRPCISFDYDPMPEHDVWRYV